MKSFTACLLFAMLAFFTAACHNGAERVAGPQEQSTETLSRTDLDTAAPTVPPTTDLAPYSPTNQTPIPPTPEAAQTAAGVSAQSETTGDASWFPTDLLPYVDKSERDLLPSITDPMMRYQAMETARQFRDFVIANKKVWGGHPAKSLDNWQSTPTQQPSTR